MKPILKYFKFSIKYIGVILLCLVVLLNNYIEGINDFNQCFSELCLKKKKKNIL